jgi:hypothetical protein
MIENEMFAQMFVGIITEKTLKRFHSSFRELIEV